MPQQEHHEPLTGGVNAGENPFNFKEGELASMYNAIYRGAQDTPIVGPKLVSKGTVTTVDGNAKGVEGLAACPFENATYIVALTKDGSLKTSSISASNFSTTNPLSTLSWSADKRPARYDGLAFQTPTDTTVLSTAQYGGKYFIFTGLDKRNLTLDSAGNIRDLGLQPVAKSFSFVSPGTQSSGTASTGVLVDVYGINPGYYTYWRTEVIKGNNGEVVAESAALSDSVAVVSVPTPSSPSQSAYVQLMYAKKNLAATHTRIYRSALPGTTNVSTFPDGVVIGELSFTSNGSTDSFYDGLVYANYNTGWGSCVGTGPQGTPPVTWQNTATGLADDSTSTYVNLSQASVNLFNQTYTLTLTLPNLPSPLYTYGSPYRTAEVVTGIVVDISCNQRLTSTVTNADAELVFTSKTGWTSISSEARRSLPAIPTTQNYITVGGRTDLWGASDYIPVSDISSGNVKLVLKFTANANASPSNPAPASYPADVLQVRNVRVKFYLDSYVSTGDVYDVINVNNQASISANTPPPAADCGTIFNDSLVVNDLSTPGRVRWSVPGMPESFPEPYYFDIPAPQNDKITGMWVVNNKLIVGTDTQMWRINYLALADDVSFQKGQICDLLDANAGCVGPLAAAVYSGMQGRAELAYLDKSGLNSTDGFATRSVANKFSLNGWMNQMRPIERKITFINESEESNLFIFAPYRSVIKGNPYVPGITTSSSSYPDSIPTSVIVFNYGNNHLSERGEFKCSGALAGLCEETVTSNDEVYLRYVYPGAACLLRNTPILKEWGPGNVHLMLVGYTCSTPTDAAPPPTAAPMGHVCWMAPYRNFTLGGDNPFPTSAALGNYSPMTSCMITRPIGLETVGGEFRTFEVYYGPRIETTSLTPKIRTFNIDQTSNETTYATLYSGNVTQKDNANLFSTAQQLTLAYDTSVPSTASSPHPHTYLLSSIIMRYDGYGKETR